MGYDSDHPLAAGEVGRVGVAIDSIEDMADAVRRHPARAGVDVDDDQRDGHHPAGALHRRRPAPGGGPLRRSPARSRTTSSRSTSRAAPTSTRRVPRCASSPTSSRSASASCRTGTRSRSAAITSARRARRRSRKWRSRSPTRSPTSQAARRRRPRRQQLRPAAVVLLQRAQRLSRGSREVPRGAPAVGADHARSLRRHQPAGAAAAVPHADGRQHARPRSSPTTTSSASRCRRWRRSSAARSRCTATAATRRWRCRPKSRRGSRCGRSRSSPHESGVAEHGRSVRRRVRDRGADQPDRERARELILDRIDARRRHAGRRSKPA